MGLASLKQLKGTKYDLDNANEKLLEKDAALQTMKNQLKRQQVCKQQMHELCEELTQFKHIPHQDASVNTDHSSDTVFVVPTTLVVIIVFSMLYVAAGGQEGDAGASSRVSVQYTY